MSQFKLNPNQAALILDVSPEGDVTVEAGDLATAICTATGQKLTEDENFQAEVMGALGDGIE